MPSPSQQRREGNRYAQGALDGCGQTIAEICDLAPGAGLTITQVKVECFVGKIEVRGGVVGLQSYLGPKIVDKRIDLNAEGGDEKRKPYAAPYQLLGIAEQKPEA